MNQIRLTSLAIEYVSQSRAFILFEPEYFLFIAEDRFVDLNGEMIFKI